MRKRYIYLITDGEYHKIGMTQQEDVYRRLRSIDSNAKTARENYSSAYAYVADISLERDLHRRFDDKRVRGEWFELDDADVAAIHNILDDECINDELKLTPKSVEGANRLKIETEKLKPLRIKCAKTLTDHEVQTFVEGLNETILELDDIVGFELASDPRYKELAGDIRQATSLLLKVVGQLKN